MKSKGITVPSTLFFFPKFLRYPSPIAKWELHLKKNNNSPWLIFSYIHIRCSRDINRTEAFDKKRFRRFNRLMKICVHITIQTWSLDNNASSSPLTSKGLSSRISSIFSYIKYLFANLNIHKNVTIKDYCSLMAIHSPSIVIYFSLGSELLQNRYHSIRLTYHLWLLSLLKEFDLLTLFL